LKFHILGPIAKHHVIHNPLGIQKYPEMIAADIEPGNKQQPSKLAVKAAVVKDLMAVSLDNLIGGAKLLGHFLSIRFAFLNHLKPVLGKRFTHFSSDKRTAIRQADQNQKARQEQESSWISRALAEAGLRFPQHTSPPLYDPFRRGTQGNNLLVVR
jgi:hypothetical protein